MTPEEWFDHLYGTLDHGWLTLFAVDRTSGHKHTRWANVTDPAEAARQAEALAATSCVWHGVATRTEKLGGGQRGGAEHCDKVPGLWLDVDIAGPGHAAVGYPPDEAAARRLVATFPIPPTVVVHSGGGLQPWWMFDEPREAAEVGELLDRWAAHWQATANYAGYKLDNVSDVARIMRVPGTLNRKTDPPRPVTVTDEAWDRRYGIDDLDQYLPDLPPPPAAPRVPYTGDDRPGDDFNKRHDAGELLERLGFHTPNRHRNGETHYVRSGKTPREGTSATVYPDGHVTVWSETCRHQWPDLKIGHGYDPFGLLVATTYRGDFAEATRDLAEQGYGEQGATIADPNWLDRVMVPAPVVDVTAIVDPPAPADLPPPRELPGIRGSTVPFPLDTLPEWIARPVAEVAESLQVPIDLPATIALGCLSSLTQGKVHVITPGTKWAEWTNLYLAVAMHVGEGKSPTYKMLTAPVYALEKEHRGALREARREAEVRKGILESRKKKAENGAATSGDPASTDEAVRLSLEIDGLVIPPDGQMIADDATPEALAILMADAGGRMTIMSPEGIVFNSMAGAYVAQGDKVNMDVYVKGFGGESLRQNRIGRGSVDIDQAILTIAVCTQPGVLEGLSKHPELAQRGATSRFMYSVPQSMVGNRDRSKKYADCDLAGWEAGATEIGRRFLANESPIRVTLTSDAALDVFDPWDQDVEDRCRDGYDLEQLAAWAQKLRSCVLRVAGLLAVADGADEIDADTMERATRIGDYWIEHAKVVHRMWGVEDPDLSIAKAAASWLTKHRAEGGTVTAAEVGKAVHHHGATKAKRAEERGAKGEVLAPALEVLVGHGWLVPLDPLWITQLGKGRASPVFLVPPIRGIYGGDGDPGTKGADIPNESRVSRNPLRRKKDHSLSLSENSFDPQTPRFRDSSDEDDLDAEAGSYPQADRQPPPPPAPVLESSGLFGGPCDDDDDSEEEQ